MNTINIAKLCRYYMPHQRRLHKLSTSSLAPITDKCTCDPCYHHTLSRVSCMSDIIYSRPITTIPISIIIITTKTAIPHTSPTNYNVCLITITWNDSYTVMHASNRWLAYNNLVYWCVPSQRMGVWRWVDFTLLLHLWQHISNRVRYDPCVCDKVRYSPNVQTHHFVMHPRKK